mgnify:CR=1 FL=1
MSLLRAWLIGTSAAFAGAMVWAFAPILVPLLIVLVVLGGLVAAVVGAARTYERRRNRARLKS